VHHTRSAEAAKRVGRERRYPDADPTRSKIVQSLLNADDAHNSQRLDEPWLMVSADCLLGLGPTGMEPSSGHHAG